MGLEIVRQGETSTFTTTLKDEAGVVIPRSALTGLTLTFKNKRAASSKGIRIGAGVNYVDCGSDASLRITGDITIEAWINLQDPDFALGLTNWEIVSSETFNVSGESGFILRVDSITPVGKLLYRTDQAGVNQVSRTLTSLTDKKWNHIVVTRAGATAIFYINGVKVTNDTSGSHINPAAATISFKIGQAFNGFMELVRVYNRVLTPAEILDRFQNDTNIQIGLISEWRFEGSAKDSKASNHGKLFGADTLKNWGIINSRYEQDVRDVGAGAVNNHTMGVTDGLLTWSMQAVDNPILEMLVPEGDLEEHVAEYTWSTTTRTGKHVVPIWTKRALA